MELPAPTTPDCDVILNMTTSGALNATDETRQIHLSSCPEMGSYDCGSMNWLHTSLFINSPVPGAAGQEYAGVGRQARDRGV